MSGGTFYEMGGEDWFFLPEGASEGYDIHSDPPVDLLDVEEIDWSAALDAYFKEKGM